METRKRMHFLQLYISIWLESIIGGSVGFFLGSLDQASWQQVWFLAINEQAIILTWFEIKGPFLQFSLSDYALVLTEIVLSPLHFFFLNFLPKKKFKTPGCTVKYLFILNLVSFLMLLPYPKPNTPKRNLIKINSVG